MAPPPATTTVHPVPPSLPTEADPLPPALLQLVDRQRRHATASKRAFDLVVAFLALVVLVPVLLAVAAAIAVLDGRPVLFRQTRVGRDGRPFTMWKFRSMVPDAESRRSELADANERSGPLFKVKDDPRVTRVGKHLRDANLDELPQLWNVVRGDMSLVGPRPALPSEVALFSADVLRRHEVRPGMTGAWQAFSRADGDFARYCALDRFYVDEHRMALDLRILAITAGQVVHALASKAASMARRVEAVEPVGEPDQVQAQAA